MITIGRPFTIPELADQDVELVPVRFPCVICKREVKATMIDEVVEVWPSEPVACLKCNPQGWMDMMILLTEDGQRIPNLCIVEVKQSNLC